VNGFPAWEAVFFMMSPGLFQLQGVLLAGAYVIGEYVLPVDSILGRAILVCQQPLSGTLRVGLEIGGTLTGDELVVPGSQYANGTFEVRLDLNRAVPANAVVRWRATSFDGPPEEAASDVGITIE
jgi:hypothetical protein